MSKTLTPQVFKDKLYNTLPPIYQKADASVNYTLQRYLSALCDGGFSYVINELNGLLDLNDPEKTPANILSLIFEQYGLKIFNDIPEAYLRKLLPSLGYAYSMKGTTTVIEYITSAISDVKVTVTPNSNFNETYHINIKLEMDYDKKDDRGIPNQEQFIRLIKEFVPFFISVSLTMTYNSFRNSDLLSASIIARDSVSTYIVEKVHHDSASMYSVGIIRDNGALFSLGVFDEAIFDTDLDADFIPDFFVDTLYKIGATTFNLDREDDDSTGENEPVAKLSAEDYYKDTIQYNSI